MSTSLGSNAQQPAAQQAAAHAAHQQLSDAHHRSALHAALYGNRSGSVSLNGLPGNPATGVYKAYDGPVPSKVALAEGQPIKGEP